MHRLLKFLVVLLIGGLSSTHLNAFEENQAPDSTGNFGSNVIRLAPLTAMDVGVGIGVSYERMLGRNQHIGIILPVNIILENKNNGDYIGTGSNSNFNTYFYFTPGIKFYPVGKRRVTYAIGTNLMIAYGKNNQTNNVTYNLNGVASEDRNTISNFRLGVLMNNYVNFQVSKHFNLGLEGGLGIRYLDNATIESESNYTVNEHYHNGFDLTGQFSLTLGFRI